MRVFGDLPVVPLVCNFGTNSTIGITIFTICTNFSTNGIIKLVKMLPTNGTIGEPRTHVLRVVGSTRHNLASQCFIYSRVFCSLF